MTEEEVVLWHTLQTAWHRFELQTSHIQIQLYICWTNFWIRRWNSLDSHTMGIIIYHLYTELPAQFMFLIKLVKLQRAIQLHTDKSYHCKNKEIWSTSFIDYLLHVCPRNFFWEFMRWYSYSAEKKMCMFIKNILLWTSVMKSWGMSSRNLVCTCILLLHMIFQVTSRTVFLKSKDLEFSQMKWENWEFSWLSWTLLCHSLCNLTLTHIARKLVVDSAFAS